MSGTDGSHLVILTPVLNDWKSLELLAHALASLPAHGPEVHIVVVDDGSAVQAPDSAVIALKRVGDVSVIRLRRTVGHQRAIALGLRYIADALTFDRLLVMDADGEDSPESIPLLLSTGLRHPGHIVVARRGKRSEQAAFQLGYRSYLVMFRTLVGLRLTFGNFVLLPSSAARRIASDESLGLNFAATVARSPIPKQEVVIDRAPRLDGESRMNRYGLVSHGLGAMAVFADRIFIRAVAASALLLSMSLIALAAVLYARLWTSTAVPGWATAAAGLSLLFAGQVLATSLLMTFVMLQQRLSLLPLIARFSESDVVDVRNV